MNEVGPSCLPAHAMGVTSLFVVSTLHRDDDAPGGQRRTNEQRTWVGKSDVRLGKEYTALAGNEVV